MFRFPDMSMKQSSLCINEFRFIITIIIARFSGQLSRSGSSASFRVQCFDQIFSRFGPFAHIEIRVAHQPAKPVQYAKGPQFCCSSARSFSVNLIVRVCQVDDNPDAVGPHIAVAVVEVAHHVVYQIAMPHQKLAMSWKAGGKMDQDKGNRDQNLRRDLQCFTRR